MKKIYLYESKRSGELNDDYSFFTKDKNVAEVAREIESVNELLDSRISFLKRYFSKDDDAKYESLAYDEPHYIFDYLDVEEGEEESHEVVESLSIEEKIEYGKWLESSGHLDIIPSYMVMDFSRYVRNEWLVHFSNERILRFEYGISMGDEELLGYTTNISKNAKKNGDYSFAFSKRGVRRHQPGKYGKYGHIFMASGVEVIHYGDQEYQVIFINDTVKNIVFVDQGDNKRYCIRHNDSDKILIESDDIVAIMDWVESNFNNYKKHIL